MRENLKKARKAAGLTQQQMADRLEITLVYYQKIESGERFVTDIEIRIFAKVLQVSFDELLNQ